MSEILIAVRYISDYLLPRLRTSPDVIEIVKVVTTNNKIPLFCEKICPGIQALVRSTYVGPTAKYTFRLWAQQLRVTLPLFSDVQLKLKIAKCTQDFDKSNVK